jgi:hypothetical protein
MRRTRDGCRIDVASINCKNNGQKGVFHLCGTSSPSKHRSHRPKPPRTDVARDCHCKLLSCSLVLSRGRNVSARRRRLGAQSSREEGLGADRNIHMLKAPRPHPSVFLDPSHSHSSPCDNASYHLSSQHLAHIHLAVTGPFSPIRHFPARHPAITLLCTSHQGAALFSSHSSPDRRPTRNHPTRASLPSAQSP